MNPTLSAYSASHRNTERLDRAIQVLIVDDVVIMPDPGDWAAHLEGNDARSRLGLGARSD